jgi:tetratricopeptide (TPR) repeat protein/GT2 family glycosyltransferase
MFPSRYLFSWRRRRAGRLVNSADRARGVGDYAAAAAFYRRALAFDPRRADIRVQLAHMLKELTWFGEAEAAYRQALVQLPNDGDLHLQLGHLLKLLGRTKEAIAAYSSAHQLSPEGGVSAAELRALGALTDDAASGGNTVASEEHIRDGDRLRDARCFAEAANAYGSALSLSPTRNDIRIQQGNMLKDAGRLAQAEAAYRCALAQAPEDAEIHLQLGHVLKLQGRRTEALLAYRRAIETQPSLEPAWNELLQAASPQSHRESFEVQAAHGGVEALLAMSEEVVGAATRLTKALPQLYAQLVFPVASYDRFRSLFDIPAPPLAGFDCSFGIVMTAAGTALERLYAQLASVSAQSYRNWQLSVVGANTALRRVAERAAMSDPRIRWIDAAEDEPASVAERRIAAALSTDWIVLLSKGALLHSHALSWFAVVAGYGAAKAFVTDEETVSDGGAARRSAPQLRQVVDYDTLLEANPFGETIVVERAAYAAIAGDLLSVSLSAARSSLLLNLAHRGTVGHIPLPLVAGNDTNSVADSKPTEAGPDRQSPADLGTPHAAAVRAHLATAGLSDRVRVDSQADAASPVSISWHPREPHQTVQVIIPTRDNAGDLRDFIESLRDHAAVPEALEVLIIDNGSRGVETARILNELKAQEGVQVVSIDEPFNWSRLNNRGAALTRSKLLVFANDDMLMLSNDWDRQLRGLLERDEIGVVGARLLYPDDSVQHAGILFSWEGLALHDGRYEPRWRAGPCRRWQVSRTVGAVTGAFLAVRRDVFEASGGFDEIGLSVAHSDIDFALKLRARGLKILWTPSITLRHYESKTRGLDHLDPEKWARHLAEQKLLEQRWGAALEVDPSVNPHWHTVDPGVKPHGHTPPPSFDLILAPPASRLWRHIRLCASANPWLPDSEVGQASGLVHDCR